MQIKVENAGYLAALRTALARIVFDYLSRESFSFEELFYPLEINEGKYAFQSYAEQMELARKSSKAGASDANGTAVREQIELYQRNITPDQSRTEPTPQSIEIDNETMRRLILDKISAQSLSETDEQSSQNLLQVEPKYAHSSLIISDNPLNSRILAVANAGHGKTTLLRRIALYYCDPIDDDCDTVQNNAAEEVKEKYNLQGKYIPCIILLRDITDKDFSVAKAIERSVISVFKGASSEEPDDSFMARIQDWLSTVQSDLLLLIDGLDELSDSMRYEFLRALDEYLADNPLTHVIMTSRVAGLSEGRIREILRKMKFRGRSIIPLEGDNVRKYAEKWIDVTQPAEFAAQLKVNLVQIMTQKRFKDYREFIRTPAELVMILKQIASDTLSSNRFQMFHDILWGYFTNHVKRYEQKRPIFEDTMTLLSFVAYRMQLLDSMFISLQELQRLSEELNRLSFHTDLVKKGTPDDYREVLDSIAANVGIIERDDRTSDIVYTFPIRAYQEFLTAYACCHLRLNAQQSRPDPFGILCGNLKDSRWISITNFALLDLETSNRQVFNAIVNCIFREVKAVEQLRAVVEADLQITKDHALVLCESVFSGQVVTEEYKELLIACMSTKSAYAYTYALRSAYRDCREDNGYLEANALACIIWEYSAGGSAYKKACSCVKSETAQQMKLGAKMLSVMARTIMDEVSAAYKDTVAKDLKPSEDLLTALAANARQHRDIVSVTALTDIWLSEAEGAEKAKPLLDAQLGEIAVEALNGSVGIIERLCLAGCGARKSAEYKQIRELVFTLGCIPLSDGTKGLSEHGEENLWVSALLQAMYEISMVDFGVDQVAAATACLYYNCWDLNRFMEAWTFDICKGRALEDVRKDGYSIREHNHFDLIKMDLEELRQGYFNAHKDNINSFNLLAIDFSYLFVGSRHLRPHLRQQLRSHLRSLFHHANHLLRVAQMPTNDKHGNDYDNSNKELQRRLRESQQLSGDTQSDEFDSLYATNPVFALFRAGDIRAAANICIKTMGDYYTSNNTNLAFLIRYGHLKQEDLESQTEYTISGLLAEGVKDKESYALLNMALYELELKHYPQAGSLLAEITKEGWSAVSNGFWYPELWQRFGDPEGALVCVLAHTYCGCMFYDYEKMLDAVKQHYGDIPKEVLKIS